ncbi:carbohydrate ABC transporter substrate-binding protein (CUT1 family) [Neobacillus bataviensis]|uniref:Carbohydrate ABC transporter substrate-binding protein (CUT1 family) n=1 Tax=Neobacillus bataviensis TaxID=220685 RepID=A0A561DZ29_9BACI|nr:extracellular solute-binding protein [Neobacillus bataviensis]TWE08590.1 carbohydrate ABC transporter substrate-binding protein (CUT1 family) [Neobacillus bataviensis]
MLKQKKILAVLSSAALIAGILTGCSSKTDGSGDSSSKEVTLKLSIGNTAVLDGIKAVSADIEKKYHIKTEIETTPTGGEGDNLVKTRLATGDMSDLLVYNSGSLLQAINPEKNFVDLTNEPFMDNVMDLFKKTVTVNGKVFGVPSGNTSAGGWLYNKKVYAELGLSVPKTWDELMANNEKIKAAGKTAVIGTYKTDWTTQLIYLADNYNVLAQEPDFAEKYTANKAKIADTPAAFRSFEKLAEVYKRGFLNKDFKATTYEQGLKMLAEGTGAHYPMLSSALIAIAKNYPDKLNDIGFFPQPSDNPEQNGLTVWMPGAVYIYKEGKNVEAAKKWVSYFVSPEGVKTYLENMNPEGPLVIKDAKMPDNIMPAVKDMLPFFESGKTNLALEFLSPIKGPSLPQITTEVGSGISSAKKGAEQYDKDVEKQAKQLGLKGW